MFFIPDHPTIYLASASPRRNALMQMGGWEFSVLPTDIDETILAGEDPSAYVLRIAIAKARAAVERLKTYAAFYSKDSIGRTTFAGTKNPKMSASTAYILAADTTVVDGKDILGKPRDEADAVCMLTRLRCRIHQVYTALALVNVDSRLEHDISTIEADNLTVHTKLCVTEVVMRNYHDDEITSYVASGDALDKAGSYAIQNEAFNPVKCIRGCYTNVMGLPLCHVAQTFREIGIRPAVQEEKIFSACQQITTEEFLDVDGCREIWTAQRSEPTSLTPSMSFSN